MSIRYMTDEEGNRVGVVLDVEEYERLREIEDEMEDLAALQAACETKRAIEHGEEVMSWEHALQEMRDGKVSTE